jgi:hypothetical protein
MRTSNKILGPQMILNEESYQLQSYRSHIKFAFIRLCLQKNYVLLCMLQDGYHCRIILRVGSESCLRCRFMDYQCRLVTQYQRR